MPHKEPTEEEVSRGQQISNKIHAIMSPPTSELVEPAVAAGLERWEVAAGFLFAAFEVIETIEDDWDKVETAMHLAKSAKRFSEVIIDGILDERKAKASKKEES